MSIVPRGIGIDLGTTNSVVAVMRSGVPKVVLNRQGEHLTPSAVGVRKGELLVGKSAKGQRSGGTILSIKRLMGLPYKNNNVQEALQHVAYKVSEGPGGEVQVHFNGRTYSPPEISAIILHRLRQDASDRLGEPIGRAVITVPAYFNDAQVAATREAGRMAGLTVLRILREPTAAALAFGIDRDVPSDENADMASVLVYDLGGGTFDISMMMMMHNQFHVMGIEGNKFLGGDNFDEEIMRYIADSTPGGEALIDDLGARLQLKNIAEEAKKELSSVNEASVLIPALAGVDVEIELPRDEFEQRLQPYVAETIALMHKAMYEAKVTPEMVDHILLVGGSTLIPMVQEALRAEFGDKKIKKNVDPMLCVAFGAAMQTAMIDQIDCPNPECHDENGQQTRNPLEATECGRCHTSLVGFDTVICPTCFLPNDASQPVCRKCKGRLDGEQESVVKSLASASWPGTDQTQFWRCWNCDFPKNPASAPKCQICGSERERGGVKCPKCSHLNPPGRDTCENPDCGEAIGNTLVDVTPEDIGIELEDGTLAVIIPKNTVYPTPVPTPYAKHFYTVEAGQRELEVIVRQGSFELAEKDEYLGMMLLGLPPDLPRAAEVTVALGLDSDGTGVATVQLREYPTIRATARFLRVGTQSPETKRKRDELIQKAEALRKNGEDLPEAREFGEDMLNEDWDRLEDEVARLEQGVKANEDIKSNLNMGKLVMAAAKDYMSTADRVELERLINNLETAIAHGQMDQARQCTKDLEGFMDIRQSYLLLAQLEAVRVNGMVSASLANQIGAALRVFKAAQGQGGLELERSLRELSGPIWDAVLKELGGRTALGGRRKLRQEAEEGRSEAQTFSERKQALKVQDEDLADKDREGLVEKPAKSEQAVEAEKGERTLPERQSKSSSPLIPETPHFSAFYPGLVNPAHTYAVVVFAHLAKMYSQIKQIADNYSAVMGAQPVSGTAPSIIQVDVGGLLTFVPFIKGIPFTPTEQVVTWQPPYQDVTFLFNVPQKVEDNLVGSIRVYQGPLIIGEIPINIQVAKTVENASAVNKEAEFRRFDPVFASYSHQDTPVMEYFRRARENMGQKMLVDIYDLRAGEYWSDRLLKMIDESAVFQLFWSKGSAQSAYCRKEWEHALQYKDKRPRFIQPVWWKVPMPSPPPELADLHFQRVSVPVPTRLQLAVAQMRYLLKRR